MVNVSVELPPTGMVVGLNAFEIVGGPKTFSGANDDPPAPPFAEFTTLVMFMYDPGVLLVTFTAIVQMEFAAIDPTLNETFVLPAATPFWVPAPHVLFSVESAIVMPVGRA